MSKPPQALTGKPKVAAGKRKNRFNKSPSLLIQTDDLNPSGYDHNDFDGGRMPTEVFYESDSGDI